MAEHLRTELVLSALNMALGQRRAKGVLHHSDHGTQYTSIAFFATLECELLGRRRFATKAEARMAIFEFIEGWYNPTRRHSGLGRISYAEFERRHSMNPEHAVTQALNRPLKRVNSTRG